MDNNDFDQMECFLENEHAATGNLSHKYVDFLMENRYKTKLVKLLQKLLTLKIGILIIVIGILFCLNFLYSRTNTIELKKSAEYAQLADENEWLHSQELNINRNLNGLPKGYLVFSSGCQIPDYNPFSHEMLKFYEKQNYTDCMPNKKPITHLAHNQKNQTVHLIFDKNVTDELYGSEPIFCCYYEITRGTDDDSKFNKSKCHLLSQTVQLPLHTEYLIVKCNNGTVEYDPGQIYVNMHFVIRERADVIKRIHRAKKKVSKKPLSVLLLGIDSISRLNLIRSMPQTRKYFLNNNWFELMGYNKIGDNTFPNLMGVLSGYNLTTAYEKCDPHVFGKLDTCPIIWKDFHDNGYATAYAEDEATLSTFNYLKYGFSKQPTDYYMRHFLLAAEHSLPIQKKSGLSYCLGYKHYAEYIFDFGLAFANTYLKQPNFGLFWVNTFSHDSLSDPSAMDLKVHNYLVELNQTGVLDESMVVFFSDHGMRFGPVRQLEIGWLEERLPFIFISLPKWFQRDYPEFVRSLNVNQNRLTTPYDLHMTLKHIIKLSNPEYAAENTHYTADACEQCQSIFYDIPINRSCSDANIEPHWCTCVKFEPIDLMSSLIQDGIKYVIDYMNTNILAQFLAKSDANNTGLLETGTSCAKLQLKEIKSARKGTMEHFHVIENYLIMFVTTPGDGVFETTLTYKKSENKFQITGSISRLNKYGNQSSCVLDVKLTKYCYCIDE